MPTDTEDSRNRETTDLGPLNQRGGLPMSFPGGREFVRPTHGKGTRAHEVVQIRAEDPWEQLSEREFQVTKLAAYDFTNKEIGDFLGVSERTAEAQVRAACKKLGVVHKDDLIALARSRGYGFGEPPRPGTGIRI